MRYIKYIFKNISILPLVTICFVLIMVLNLIKTTTDNNRCAYANADYGSLFENSNKKVLKIYFVSSYNDEHICGAPQLNGLQYELRKYIQQYNFNIRGAYLNSRTQNTNPFRLDDVCKLVIDKIKLFDPDIVVTIDDIAFEKVGIPIANYGKSVFFSGLNRPFTSYANDRYINKANVFGVEERIQLDCMFKLMQQSRFNPSNFYILTDNTVTSYYMTKNYQQEISDKSLYRPDIITIKTVVDLRDAIIRLQKEHPGVLILAFQSLLDEDGTYITKQDAIFEVLKYNKKHLELGGNGIYSRYGISVCISPNFYEMGKLLSHMIIEYIQGKIPSPQIQYPINSVTINSKRLRELKFKEIYSKTISLVDKTYDNY